MTPRQLLVRRAGPNCLRLLEEAESAATSAAEEAFYNTELVPHITESLSLNTKPRDVYGLLLEPIIADEYEAWYNAYQPRPTTGLRGDIRMVTMITAGLTSIQRGGLWPQLAAVLWPDRWPRVPTLVQDAAGMLRTDERQIRRDALRTMPGLVMARPREVIRTYRLMRAWCGVHGDAPYGQGLNLLCAVAAFFILDDRDALRVVTALTSVVVPGYYGHSLDGHARDAKILQGYLRTRIPGVARQLEEWGVILHFVAAWFGPVFVGVLPPSAVFQLWDRLLFFGPVVLFETTIRLLWIARADIHTSFEATMQRLNQRMQRTFDLDEVDACNVPGPAIVAACLRARRATSLNHL